ncbi:hypothetical protein PHLGIDRAFT_373552 [Phlebiopsis gigantea 11061_1 CR5-6]|uniref:Uncharacterized protein n=1 Tax=Phlebiopsis gigantea (strain 11061_1 CR5-6) TaxID=745531 RepID=A0A0C3NTL7_PHLG1|nr:hypothetical protein PHLGIDRAFT_373552 [Phlebiopsis gigantea 11061_1 CR5-6]
MVSPSSSSDDGALLVLSLYDELGLGLAESSVMSLDKHEGSRRQARVVLDHDQITTMYGACGVRMLFRADFRANTFSKVMINPCGALAPIPNQVGNLCCSRSYLVPAGRSRTLRCLGLRGELGVSRPSSEEEAIQGVGEQLEPCSMASTAQSSGPHMPQAIATGPEGSRECLPEV